MASIAAMVVGLSFVTLAWAQTGVTLTGNVQDPSGARIPNAIIVLTDLERDVVEAATSRADGSFRIRGIPPSSSYRVNVQALGFAPHDESLDLSADAALEVTLEVGKVQEAIVVAGKRPGQSEDPGAQRRRIRVGGKVERAKMTHYVQPVYPSDTQAEGIEGTVLLEAVISTAGVPTNLRGVNGAIDARLTAAAVEAVRHGDFIAPGFARSPAMVLKVPGR